jgi:Uri superfamily endonuclease
MMHTDGKGVYVLILYLPYRRTIQIGRLGKFNFSDGYYAYVGSAFGPGGLAARLSHHLRRSHKPRWHIDYLRRHVDITDREFRLQLCQSSILLLQFAFDPCV